MEGLKEKFKAKRLEAMDIDSAILTQGFKNLSPEDAAKINAITAKWSGFIKKGNIKEAQTYLNNKLNELRSSK